MDEITISGLPTASGIDATADWMAVDRTSLNTTQKINRNTYLGITGSPVGTTDSQTLTNKTLTSPTISGPSLSGTVTGTYTLGGTPTFPSTVVSTTGTQTLTNKTLTAPVINNGSITGTTITTDAIVGQSSASSGTIYGVAVSSGTIGAAGIASSAVTTAKILDGAVTPNKLQASTGTTWAWTSFTSTPANFTTGNGSITGTYKQTGKTVQFEIQVVLGSTSSVGTGPTFSLPVSANSKYNFTTLPQGYQVGVSSSWDASSPNDYFYYATVLVSSTTVIAKPTRGDGTWTYSSNVISATQPPASWGTGDVIFIQGTYEAA